VLLALLRRGLSHDPQRPDEAAVVVLVTATGHTVCEGADAAPAADRLQICLIFERVTRLSMTAAEGWDSSPDP
jgi:hypothetical protein